MGLSTTLPVTLATPETWTTSTGTPVTDRYEIVREVGRGGMGVVYKARHRQLEKEVAIKVLLPGASEERFRREARLLAKIRSPHVVAVHDFDVLANGFPMLAMEWIEGTDLAKTLLATTSPLPEEQVLPWMRQVGEGMLAAAEQGIIHRDLKPSNILIDTHGKALVADFGLARGPVGLAELSHSGAVMGTPHYMAPEQAESPRSVDTRADVYSFGATFYRVLTGCTPFEGESVFSILFKHKVEPLVAPRARNPNLSERVSALLERCMAKSPAERFPSFAELLQHLQPTPSPSSPWEGEDDAELARHLAPYHQRRAVYLSQPSALTAPEVYQFPNGRVLKIVYGDIVGQEVDAVVSSDDEYLSMGGGVSWAIRKAAGAELMDWETRKYVPVRPGRVVVTSAGRLKARFVFHGVTLAFPNGSILWPSRDLIIEILQSCMYHADSLNVRSLALPLLGTGVGQFSREVCLDTMVSALAKALLRGLTSVCEGRIVLFG
jgi:O-acetyl-ADP-ribose deacetylase (regulator of RNase III)/tRNA A-37 threonylcarbamoyl transferase component Bud32